MILTVNQDDIYYGVPRDPANCAIALTIRRLLPPNEYKVLVGYEYVTIKHLDSLGSSHSKLPTLYRFPLPSAARKWIKEMDTMNYSMEPIAFRLDIDDWLEQAIKLSVNKQNRRKRVCFQPQSRLN
jgi:hypothetical protein